MSQGVLVTNPLSPLLFQVMCKNEAVSPALVSAMKQHGSDLSAVMRCEDEGEGGGTPLHVPRRMPQAHPRGADAEDAPHAVQRTAKIITKIHNNISR